MHEIEVDVVQSQVLETQIKCFLHTRVVAAPQFRGDKNIFSLDFARCKCLLQPISNFLLILIAKGSINVPVADRDGMANSSLDLARTRLPRPCSNQQYSVASMRDAYQVQGLEFPRLCSA